MRVMMMLLAATLAAAGTAQAQTTAAADEKGYVEVVLQSAFGNVTSQNFGVEGGVTVFPQVQIFAEAGRTRDVSTTALSNAAQTIAGALALVAANTGYSVKEPVTFGDVGLRYLLPVSGTRIAPYVLGGVGIAKVTQNVKFTVAGQDVTSTIDQYGIVLGSDLSGDFTKPLVTVGVGVAVPVLHSLLLDFQYRYGRIFAEGDAISVSRAGLGVGVRF